MEKNHPHARNGGRNSFSRRQRSLLSQSPQRLSRINDGKKGDRLDMFLDFLYVIGAT